MRLAVIFLVALGVSAQTKSFVGTVTGFKPEAAEVEVKPDNGAAVSAKVSAETLAQKIAPGEKDLRKAEAIKVTDVALGDRVLLTLDAAGTGVRRIVVMSATEIARHDEADKMDWQKRGVSGVVEKKSGDEITVKIKGMTGDSQAVVTVSDSTTYKRYSPDSVKFADAKSSKLAEVSVGDQLRARGQKSDDGLKVTAQDVVFGTFVTKGGAITSVNPETHEIVIKEMGTDKPLTIKLTADSQIKKMPSMPMMGMMGGAPGRGGPPSGGPGGPPAGAAGPGRGGMDLSQMLERMPASKIEDLQPGETVVVSSTKGARNDQLTAITLLGNAEMLIRMAAMMSGGGRSAGGAGRGGGMAGGGMGGMMGGGGLGDLGGLGMPGIIP